MVVDYYDVFTHLSQILEQSNLKVHTQCILYNNTTLISLVNMYGTFVTTM